MKRILLATAGCVAAVLAVILATSGRKQPGSEGSDALPGTAEQRAPAPRTPWPVGQDALSDPRETVVQGRDGGELTGRAATLARVRVGYEPMELRPFEGDGFISLRGVGDSRVVALPVSNGRISVKDLAPEKSWVVDGLELAGEPASSSEFKIVTTEAISESGVDALWLRGRRFEVLDRLTGEHLSGVRVEYSEAPSARYQSAVRNASFADELLSGVIRVDEAHETHARDRRRLPPVRARVQKREGVSPFNLVIPSSTGTYWFTAPGYEWQPWPGEESDAPVIRLARVGSLRIELVGAEQLRARQVSIRVRSAHGSVVFEHEPTAATPIDVVHLLPGEYLVQLLDSWNTTMIDSVRAEVIGGERSSVLLDTSGGPSELAALAGSLSIDDRDGYLETPSLTLASKGGSTLRELVLTSKGTGYYTWDAGLVDPGDYSIVLGEYPITWRVKALVHELNRAELEVPDLRRRRVVVMADDREVLCNTVSWQGEADDRFRQIARDADFVLHGPLPASNLSFLVETEEFGSEWILADVAPGQERVVLQSERTQWAAIELQVFDGKEAVPVSMDWLSSVVVRDAEGHQLSPSLQWNWDGQGLPTASLRVDASGPVELVPPRRPGFPKLARTWTTATRGQSSAVEWPIAEQ